MAREESVLPANTEEGTVLGTWPRRLPRALFESALIVFSVLLALVVDEWRESRRQAVRADVAIEAIVAELQSNRAAAEQARQFHRGIREKLAAIPEGESPSLEFATNGLFNPASVVQTAWVSAQETGALQQVPYALLLQISRMYERQRSYSDLARQLVADIYTDLRSRSVDDVLREGYRGFLLLTQDFATRENELINQYDLVLAAIAAR